MNGRTSPEDRRRIQTNGSRNEKASRLSREKSKKTKTRPDRTAEGDSRGQSFPGRERRHFIRNLSPPPRLLHLTSPPAAGAAARTGQDQGGGACPFRTPLIRSAEVQPAPSLCRFIFRGEFFTVSFLFRVKDWGFLRERF